MKRIFLSAVALMSLLHLRAQSTNDSTAFKSRKLKVEEINLVSSYYSQQGDHAAVTGGRGSQQLSDIANTLDIKLVKYDRQLRKHTFDAEVGIDHYTSASSDRIDLKANSSASHADTRIYPSLNWTMENERKGNGIGAGLSYSSEFDYQSLGVSGSFSKKTADRNGEFNVRLQALFDKVSDIKPVELRTNGSGGEDDDYPGQNRRTFTAAFSWSQVINDRLQIALLADVVQQSGFLSLPFYRVYFNDASVHQEHLPDTRFKLPVGIRASYFIGDNVILRGYYRYYTDNWGIRSHTANLEVPVKLNPFISFSPFYRFYSQTGTRYFAPYGVHTATDDYYTSNYDLSTFQSHFAGLGLRWTPLKGIAGIQKLSMAEIRYGHYTKNIAMNANIVTLNLRFR
ncbi:DUF3570 domain-containing protein [Nostoc ellipsosporum NOK]|nr:DUF3570 domain-containing protein [Nostoc ellipsosporum NOK]